MVDNFDDAPNGLLHTNEVSDLDANALTAEMPSEEPSDDNLSSNMIDQIVALFNNLNAILKEYDPLTLPVANAQARAFAANNFNNLNITSTILIILIRADSIMQTITSAQHQT